MEKKLVRKIIGTLKAIVIRYIFVCPSDDEMNLQQIRYYIVLKMIEKILKLSFHKNEMYKNEMFPQARRQTLSQKTKIYKHYIFKNHLLLFHPEKITEKANCNYENAVCITNRGLQKNMLDLAVFDKVSLG